MSRPSFLALRGVRFGFAGQPPVIQDLDLELAPGDIHCLVGRSGCGKTTLLKLAAGLLPPDAGSVTIRGAPPHDRRAVGFVFQQPTLLDWLSVRDNVLLPVSLQHRPTDADRQVADALLAQLGLAPYGARFPRQLSGGQQSRVALAHDINEAVFLGDRVSVLAAGRLVRQLTVPADAARDTPAFGACCAALRDALGRDELGRDETGRDELGHEGGIA